MATNVANSGVFDLKQFKRELKHTDSVIKCFRQAIKETRLRLD